MGPWRSSRWGDASGGGDSSLVRTELQEGVQELLSTNASFAAIKRVGAPVFWGVIRQSPGFAEGIVSLQGQSTVQGFYEARSFGWAVLEHWQGGHLGTD